ncbi:UNVERIFIED_CONTAM: hypothetical protein Slati_4467400 [Sesamum latifolium]|uniref:Uncharacterized protein n=1 Tax=Sesamum latifolium TaxID=2727402 RepID=A0AAW2SRD7_9LAMI
MPSPPRKSRPVSYPRDGDFWKSLARKLSPSLLGQAAKYINMEETSKREGKEKRIRSPREGSSKNSRMDFREYLNYYNYSHYNKWFTSSGPRRL